MQIWKLHNESKTELKLFIVRKCETQNYTTEMSVCTHLGAGNVVSLHLPSAVYVCLLTKSSSRGYQSWVQ